MGDNADKAVNLIRRQAELRKLVEHMGWQISAELNRCTYSRTHGGANQPERISFYLRGPELKMANNCIEAAIGKSQHERDEGGANFELAWDQMVEAGEVCVHCLNARAIKAMRKSTTRRLGAVKGAITKLGNKLAKAGSFPGVKDDEYLIEACSDWATVLEFRIHFRRGLIIEEVNEYYAKSENLTAIDENIRSVYQSIDEYYEAKRDAQSTEAEV